MKHASRARPARAGRHALLFLAVAAIALVAYLPSFSAPFQFDDYARIVENEGLRSGDLRTAIGWLGMTRVIPSATLLLNFRLGGEETFGYHVVNFALHLLATLGVFQLALALCRTPRGRVAAPAGHDAVFAAAAAFLFACHPLQTQAVTYIIQRASVMAALFYVWSVVFYLWARERARGRRAAFYAAAVVLALAAVVSKENAVTLPITILLVEATFYGVDRRKLGRALPFAAAGVLVLLLPLAWRAWNWQPKGRLSSATWLTRLHDTVFEHGAGSTLATTPLQYLLTQSTVLPRYLRLFVLPVGLNVDPDVPLQTGLTWPVVAGLLFLAAFAAAGAFCLRRRPFVALGIFWFFVALSVESSFIPILDLMMEHRMYLAMPGLCLVTAALLTEIRWPRPRVAGALALAIVVALPALTYARNRTWRSALALWTDAVAKSPNKARVHVNAGVAHHGVEHLDEAIRHYCRALELDPKIAIARENLEVALEQQGRLDAIVDDLIADANVVAQRPDGSFVVEYDVAAAVCPTPAKKDEGR